MLFLLHSEAKRKEKLGFIQKNGDLHNTRRFKLKELFFVEKSDKKRRKKILVCFAVEWIKGEQNKIVCCETRRKGFFFRQSKQIKKVLGRMGKRRSHCEFL
jgi:hypothetical protein